MRYDQQKKYPNYSEMALSTCHREPEHNRNLWKKKSRTLSALKSVMGEKVAGGWKRGGSDRLNPSESQVQ